ncbi:MAG: hypothetical protein ABI605_03425, partial [Rhizobacter sp.]
MASLSLDPADASHELDSMSLDALEAIDAKRLPAGPQTLLAGYLARRRRARLAELADHRSSTLSRLRARLNSITRS